MVTLPAWLQKPVTQPYGVNGEQGMDVGTPFHTAVTAPYGGKVTRTGCYGYGCEVDIAANVPGLGNVTEYVIHLDEIAAGIVAGRNVNPGALLGLSGGETDVQVAQGLFPGAQHPVHNPPGVTLSTGPHTEIGFVTNGATPFTSSAQTVNPAPYLMGVGGGGGGGGGQTPGVLSCLACAANPNDTASCEQCGLAEVQNASGQASAAGGAADSLGSSIGQGIAAGLANAGNSFLHVFGFSSASDAAWRTGLVLVGLAVLVVALFLLFRPQLETAGRAVGKAAEVTAL